LVVWKLGVFLRFLELVLDVLLDTSRCPFTLRVDLFGAALFTVSVLGGFFGLVPGVVLRWRKEDRVSARAAQQS
jgi:hypothetical protein